jgi:hypothetical protein
MSASTPIVVSVTRHFPVPRERVFDAWLDPARIEGWMFGASARDEEILHLRNDPRVSGRFSFPCGAAGNASIISELISRSIGLAGSSSPGPPLAPTKLSTKHQAA